MSVFAFLSRFLYTDLDVSIHTFFSLLHSLTPSPYPFRARFLPLFLFLPLCISLFLPPHSLSRDTSVAFVLYEKRHHVRLVDMPRAYQRCTSPNRRRQICSSEQEPSVRPWSRVWLWCRRRQRLLLRFVIHVTVTALPLALPGLMWILRGGKQRRPREERRKKDEARERETETTEEKTD